MYKPAIKIDTAAPRNPDASILLIYTGGTLGMSHNAKGTLVPFDFEQIIARIPSLKRFNLVLTVIAFEELLDSANASPDTWVKIGNLIYENYEAYDGFVVLHGTDTMAYSASALSFMLQNLAKPVVFTGAQLPIGEVRTDARENLLGALEIASAKRNNGSPRVPEVSLYFNDRLLRGNRAKKVQSIFFDAFESHNHPLLAEAGVEIIYNKRNILRLPEEKLRLRNKFHPRVAVLKIFPGMQPRLIQALLRNADLAGLILETYGSGNAPTYPWFVDELKEALDSGVIILNVSQCQGGKVVQGRYGTSRILEDIGVLSGYDLTTEAALTKMMLLLGEESSVEEVKAQLIIPQCGEMSIR
jgi:L-asparaginase